MMEGLERYSAEVRDRELTLARYSSFGAGALDPFDLILPAGAEADARYPGFWDGIS